MSNQRRNERKAWGKLFAFMRKHNRGKLDLQDAYLLGADLRGVDLQKADLRGAFLRGADLREADLREAILQNVDLREALLQKAKLAGANLDYPIGMSSANRYPVIVASQDKWAIGCWQGDTRSTIKRIEEVKLFLPALAYLCSMLALAIFHAPKDATRQLALKVREYCDIWLEEN